MARVLRDVAPTLEVMVRNLRDAEVIVPIRERSRFTRELIAQLPRLKLISQTVAARTMSISPPALSAASRSARARTRPLTRSPSRPGR